MSEAIGDFQRQDRKSLLWGAKRQRKHKKGSPESNCLLMSDPSAFPRAVTFAKTKPISPSFRAGKAARQVAHAPLPLANVVPKPGTNAAKESTPKPRKMYKCDRLKVFVVGSVPMHATALGFASHLIAPKLLPATHQPFGLCTGCSLMMINWY